LRQSALLAQMEEAASGFVSRATALWRSKDTPAGRLARHFIANDAAFDAARATFDAFILMPSSGVGHVA
jgi:hypothetical protein